MVRPINTNLDEGEGVEEEGRKDGAEAGWSVEEWDLELEDHDGDNDGDDAVGEGLEASGAEALRAHGDTVPLCCRSGARNHLGSRLEAGCVRAAGR